MALTEAPRPSVEQAPSGYAMLRCSRPHRRFPGKLCNNLLARLPNDLLEAAARLHLEFFCDRCKQMTVYE